MPDSPLRPRLLIVESDDSVRRVLGRVLARRFEVTPLATATSALGRLKEERFDVMLLDLGVPDMKSMDVLRAVLDVDATLPVIVTTPTPSAEAERVATALGAIAFLTKPVALADLDEPLARAATLSHARRAG